MRADSHSSVQQLTFVDVPEAAHSFAILGVCELTRVELLRDVFVWAYERSTQEHLAIKQDLVEPDPDPIRSDPIRTG